MYYLCSVIRRYLWNCHHFKNLLFACVLQIISFNQSMARKATNCFLSLRLLSHIPYYHSLIVEKFILMGQREASPQTSLDQGFCDSMMNEGMSPAKNFPGRIFQFPNFIKAENTHIKPFFCNICKPISYISEQFQYFVQQVFELCIILLLNHRNSTTPPVENNMNNRNKTKFLELLIHKV